jgi:hypothetical protein
MDLNGLLQNLQKLMKFQNLRLGAGVASGSDQKLQTLWNLVVVAVKDDAGGLVEKRAMKEPVNLQSAILASYQAEHLKAANFLKIEPYNQAGSLTGIDGSLALLNSAIADSMLEMRARMVVGVWVTVQMVMQPRETETFVALRFQWTTRMCLWKTLSLPFQYEMNPSVVEQPSCPMKTLNL